MDTLKDAVVGSTVTVRKVHGFGAWKRRMLDLGIYPGASIFVRRESPFGDSIQICVCGSELCLCRQDARWVEVMELGSSDRGS